jgi:hypothetical protein
MTRKEKCRCISTVLIFLLGVVGLVAFTYGGIHLYRVSKSAAENDSMMPFLSPFVRCQDYCDSLQGDAEHVETMCRVVKRSCQAKQAPAVLSIGFATAFTALALLAAPCAFKKDVWFGFGVFSTLAIASTLVAIVTVGAFTLPVVSNFVDCHKFDDATIAGVTGLGLTCIKSPPTGDSTQMDVKSSAAKWMCKLCMFFGGATANIAVMLLFFLARRCCKSSCGAAAAVAAQEGSCQRKCLFRRCFSSLRTRWCSRGAPLASSADRDDGVPVSAPSFYDVSGEGQVASEDAGASASQEYRQYTVQ